MSHINIDFFIKLLYLYLKIQKFTRINEFPPVTMILLYKIGFKSTSHIPTLAVTILLMLNVEGPIMGVGLNKVSGILNRSLPNS